MDQRPTDDNMFLNNSGGASVKPSAPPLSQDKMNSDNQYFETAEIATPDLTTSGDALDPSEEEKRKEELRAELAKVEEEIQMFRSLLEGKIKRSQTLKRQLGITPLNQVKHDLSEGIKHIKDSTAYQKTSEKVTQAKDKIQQTEAYQKTNDALRAAGEKTSSALSSVGASMSKKLGNIRNSDKFRSLEERVGSAYSSVKSKVVGSKSEDNFEDVLNRTAAANGGKPKTEQPLPEEKVPL